LLVLGRDGIFCRRTRLFLMARLLNTRYSIVRMNV
jgi:hypothetical protein